MPGGGAQGVGVVGWGVPIAGGGGGGSYSVVLSMHICTLCGAKRYEEAKTRRI